MTPLRMSLPGFALLAVLATSPASAVTYVVRPDGTGSYPTIQAAINAASNTDVIELTNGTFLGDGNRDIDFLGKAIVVQSQNGAANCVIDPQGGGIVEHRGFFFNSTEGPQSVLDGVTITDGGGESPGGGIAVNSSPTIRNCIIRKNQVHETHAGGAGGGIAVGGSSSAHFVSCTIDSNSAGSTGGGEGGGAVVAGSPLFEDCVFSDNSATSGFTPTAGGNIFGESTTARFVNCTIRRGIADQGAGIYCDPGSAAQFTDCLIADNTAELTPPADQGGGAYFASSGDVLDHCILAGNGAFSGEAIFCQNASPTIHNCTLYGNEWVGGPPGTDQIDLAGDSTPIFENTIISFGHSGASIGCHGTGMPSLSCCDIYGNADGDWVSCVAGQQSMNGNLALDPLFCDAQDRDFGLHANSPCLPGGSCGLIGALPMTCGATATSQVSWGHVKGAFGH